MGLFFTKGKKVKGVSKHVEVPRGEKQQLEAYECWAVRWRSRYGELSYSTQDEMEIFTSEEDAKKFFYELKAAYKLLKHTSGTEVEIIKNK